MIRRAHLLAGLTAMLAVVHLAGQTPVPEIAFDSPPGVLKLPPDIYLGEVAQYELLAGELCLKVLELNPRFIEQAQRGEVYASVEADDVVVLTD